MRVLFATFAEKTHFLGMVPLAWAFRTAGHEVRVASQPELTGVISGAGLTAVPVGTDHALPHVLRLTRRLGPDKRPGFDMMEDRPEKLTWEYLRRGYREILLPLWWKIINESMIGDLVAFSRGWRPDLVIWEPLTFAGPIAAKASGAVHARLPFALDLAARIRGHFLRALREQPPEARDDPLARWLGARMAAYGGAFSEDMTCGQFTIDYLPARLRLPLDLHQVPMRFVPYNGRAIVPRWLRDPPDRPRVALSLGTSATERLGGYAVSVADIFEALADLDIDIVATLPEDEGRRLGRVPGNTRLVGYTPLHALVATCAGLINHGGASTVCTGLRYGVPQLIIPHHMFDEPLLAARLADAGAGIALDGADSGDQIRRCVERLVGHPGLRDGADRLRNEMASMPSPSDVVSEIEELVETLRVDQTT